MAVDLDDVTQAKNILNSYKKISARDALHVAHMKRYNIKTILTFDVGFDEIKWIERLPEI